MTTADSLIADTLDRILTAHVDRTQLDAVADGRWPTELWNALAETGLAFATHHEDLPLEDAYASLTMVGRHAAPVPLAETLVAGELLRRAGMEMEPLPFGLAFIDESAMPQQADTFTGVLQDIAFGRHLQRLILVASDGRHWLLSEVDKATVEGCINIAGEPRDRLVFSQPVKALPLSGQSTARTFMLAALTRVLMMAGAIESVLRMSVQYALERVQFGRPIARFQAIQQQLAASAGEVVAALQAAQTARLAVNSSLLPTEIAIAKARVGEAAGIVSEIGHQVHGAIGFTYEHMLHYRVRRLWAWRDELGHEAQWQRLLGRFVVAKGADSLWQFITSPEPIDLEDLHP